MEAVLGALGAILAVVLPLMLAGWLLGRRNRAAPQRPVRGARAKMPE